MIETIQNLISYQATLATASMNSMLVAVVLFDIGFVYSIISAGSERKPSKIDKWILIGLAIVLSALVLEFSSITT